MTEPKISDVMVKEIVTIPSDANVREVASLMLKKMIGSVAVKQDGVIVGIITKTDFVRAHAQRTEHRTAGEMMSSPIIKVDYDDHLFDALKVMRDHNIKHVFVENEKEIAGLEFIGVVGIATVEDILRGLRR